VKIGTTIKAVYGLPRSAPSTMVNEDIDRFGMGITSLAVPYATSSAQLLMSSLQDQGTLGKVTRPYHGTRKEAVSLCKCAR
jgi:hypothetical protein